MEADAEAAVADEAVAVEIADAVVAEAVARAVGVAPAVDAGRVANA